jgi:hypothetical protein
MLNNDKSANYQNDKKLQTDSSLSNCLFRTKFISCLFLFFSEILEFTIKGLIFISSVFMKNLWTAENMVKKCFSFHFKWPNTILLLEK